MKIVHAYRDNGWMSPVTRWKPRRVYCTEHADHGDEPGVEHVVKFRQGRDGAAALISELVCGQLFAAGGLATLDLRLVSVRPSFAASYQTKPEIPYTIEEGLHFGTVLRHDVESGPPLQFDDLAEPRELVEVWAFDSWVCTIDRIVEGNILLALSANGRFHLIPADQSDCFGGAGRFADGTWKRVFEEPRAAQSVNFLDRAILEAGAGEALASAIEKVAQAAESVDHAIAAIPAEWWRQAGLVPADAADGLKARAQRMREILNLEHWEGLDHDIQGGQLL